VSTDFERRLQNAARIAAIRTKRRLREDQYILDHCGPEVLALVRRRKTADRASVIGRPLSSEHRAYISATHRNKAPEAKRQFSDKCRTAMKAASLRLMLDHDHVGDVVRGALCNGCNVGLGGFSRCHRPSESGHCVSRISRRESGPALSAALATQSHSE
jgi:hypothetical protein